MLPWWRGAAPTTPTMACGPSNRHPVASASWATGARHGRKKWCWRVELATNGWRRWWAWPARWFGTRDKSSSPKSALHSSPTPQPSSAKTDTGGITIGSSSDTVSESILTSQPLSAVLAKRAVQAFPALAALNIVRTWTGFRIMPPDGLPIYEQSSSAPGAFVIACHSGVTLASNHALELASRILAGQLGADLEAFHSGRFRVSQTH